MTPDQFWYDDIDLVGCYIKAYYNRLNKEAWVTGLYNIRASSVAISNVMPKAIIYGLAGKELSGINYYETPIPDMGNTNSAKEDTKTASKTEVIETVARKTLLMFK